VFFQVGAAGTIAPSLPAKTASGRQDVQRGYDEALDRESRVEELRRRAVEAARARRDDITAFDSARDQRRAVLPSILNEMCGAPAREGSALPAVTVIALRGSTRDLDSVLEAMRQAGRAVESCVRSTAPEFAGPVPMLVEVSGDGRVVAARPAGRGPALDVGTCIAPVLTSLRLPEIEDAGVSMYGVFYRLRLDTAEPIAIPGMHQSPPSAQPDYPGVLHSSIVREIIGRSMDSLRACYTRALREEPELAGRVTVGFVIGAYGSVRAARVEDTSLPDEVGSCLVDQVRTLRFPTPEGGNVPLSYTFSFQ
jgi:hypothetical protein